MEDNLRSDPRRDERYCKCGEIKILHVPFCGGYVCKTLSRKIELSAIEHNKIQKAQEFERSVARELKQIQLAREQEKERVRVAREKEIRKQKAESKKQFSLNADALKWVLRNAENKRDVEAKMLLDIQKKTLNQSVIDKQIKKYQSAIRAVEKAQRDLLRHQRGL
jgi:hypothetical protein